jgi:uncharacterized membrane protein YhaH (DUF805 family)
MNWTYLLTSLDGRIARKPYWVSILVLFIVAAIAQLIAYLIGGLLLVMLVGFATLYPSFALNVKRGHDRNRPTWLMVVFFVLLIIVNIIQFFGLDMVNDEPTALFFVVSVPWFLFALFVFIDLGFLRGTPGPNQYGPDPLASG